MADPHVEEDVITLLLRQHGEIRELFAEFEMAKGDPRRDAFRRLVRLLAVHETAEEEVVHPVARSLDGGEPIVDARIGEECRRGAPRQGAGVHIGRTWAGRGGL